ncbi:glycosyltransferase [Flavivirga rizhaonensis]|uniref:Glycosyltransferase n=1 Tax=Flavivirga rizhaonensis TaxID=2559571 RepID=A0A4V3P581_9FLAO|nr:glycosyltransferase [Flavivirga rizhaonensis]TGV04354.1 glycosyltransferase [Flavivirga rizhaonensis]
MKFLERGMKMLIVGSYPPRKCGIATFSNDTFNAIRSMFGSTLPIEVCALQNEKTPLSYNQEVSYVLVTSVLENYRLIAEKINERNDIGLVCIQHEFGLFGGVLGDYLLAFLLALNKPVITIFHTVLPNPGKERKKVIQTIDSLSDKLIALTKKSKDILVNDYNCSKYKVRVIPHGTHVVLWEDKSLLKHKYRYDDKIVLSTFGLLSKNKHIETALFALKDIVKKHPNVVYLVIGKTHPEIIKREGEAYRNGLMEITKNLKLEDNVIFINKYLKLKQLLEYLTLSDIYLFTSKDPNQAVSGTLVYALSCGCAVISNPIPHALEILRGGNGILLENFGDNEELKQHILDLVENESKRANMAKNAFANIRFSTWENVAIKYGLLFGELTERIEDLRFNLPPIKLDHIKKLTTNYGILQFSNFSQPDINSGYTLDDNARALINIIMHYNLYGGKSVLNYANIYLGFIENIQRESGWFDNYLNYELELTKQNSETNLEDANGRAIWSLGYVIGHKEILPSGFVKRAKNCWHKIMHRIDDINSPRAIAYSIKGLSHYYAQCPDEFIKNKVERFANKLLQHYKVNYEEGWHWYEDYMTYANNILPEAMMYSYLITKNEDHKNIAEITFDFLLSQYFMKRQIKVISNRGWFKKKNERVFYGEQPIEIVTTIIALDLFYRITSKARYKNQLEIAYSWFLGNNHLNQVMYNSKNGASYDGLEDTHVNINQGAESTLCFLKAQMIIDKYSRKIKTFRHYKIGKKRNLNIIFSNES